MRQILIGITCNYLAEVPDAFHAGIGAKEQAWQLIAQDYLDAVWKAGGIPVLIPIDKEADRACGILNTIDGLIISGGNDVSPSLYGERVTCCGSLDPERDRYEMETLKESTGDGPSGSWCMPGNPDYERIFRRHTSPGCGHGRTLRAQHSDEQEKCSGARCDGRKGYAVRFDPRTRKALGKLSASSGCERSGTGTRGFCKDGGRNRRGCGITGKEICGGGSMASGNDV